jgi:hypothetical protein
MRKPGFIIDVPMTLSVAVHGVTEEEAKAIARAFADSLDPSEHFVRGYMDTKREEEKAQYDITEVSLCSPSDESCEVLDELEAECTCGRTIDDRA